MALVQSLAAIVYSLFRLSYDNGRAQFESIDALSMSCYL